MTAQEVDHVNKIIDVSEATSTSFSQLYFTIQSFHNTIIDRRFNEVYNSFFVFL